MIIPQLDKVLSYDSLQKAALLFRAILLIDKDKNQSVEDLTNLILVDPQNLMAYFVRGVLSTELEKFSPAFSDFQRVIKATATSDNNFAGQQTGLDKKIDIQNAGAYTLSRIYGLPEDDANKLKQAYCLIVTGKYEKAITIINETSKPNHEPLSAYLKAVAYEHAGQHPKAFNFYNLALELDKEIADAYKKRAIYEQEMNRWDKSIADLSAALRLEPGTYVLNKIRGVSYYHSYDYPRAIADFTTYLRFDSTNKEVLGFRGMAYQKNHQFLDASVDLALSDNEQVLEFKKMESHIDSVLLAGDTTRALQYLHTLTNAVPVFTEGFVQKFKIYIARDSWKPIKDEVLLALRNVRQDVEGARQSYLLTLHAMVLVDEHHHEDAIAVFNEAIKVDKKNELAYLQRGKLYLELGKSTKAENDFKQASALGNKQAAIMLSSTTP